MKNVQVIDGAKNCTYDIYAVTDREYALLFPDDADVEFIADFVARVGKKTALTVTRAMY